MAESAMQEAVSIKQYHHQHLSATVVICRVRWLSSHGENTTQFAAAGHRDAFQ